MIKFKEFDVGDADYKEQMEQFQTEHQNAEFVQITGGHMSYEKIWFKYEPSDTSSTTDKLSVKKLQEELASCIQTLISVSILANGDENIVIGNFVDSKLSKLAKTHENVTKYIEKVTGKNIDVVLAENAALEAEEEE
ncbi:hypothetical protein LMG8526HA_00202 [Lactococcus lactis]|uniref:hypothetical protein n=1 Tax=Lactococcus lactis TaxID=1358 RepID=UPI0007256B25|nr:hypothetical protein [Lactococcus lactis]KSU12974.1 prophage pi3 protein 34 [Lactococcus lactis subsp. lactis]MDU0399365.1 hypothetical protein [Lactococcus lactis]